MAKTVVDLRHSSHRDLLEAKGFAHLASLGPDGEPQSHPVWYDFDGEHLLLSTTKARQKYHNVERDPRVALSILDPSDPYRHLEIRGRVTSIEDDPHYRFIDSLAQKYLNEPRYPYTEPGDERVIITVRPERANTSG